jgi:ribulose bisphosphate carboxylase small subunit
MRESSHTGVNDYENPEPKSKYWRLSATASETKHHDGAMAIVRKVRSNNDTAARQEMGKSWR